MPALRPDPNSQDLLTKQEVARMVQVSVRTIARYVELKKFPQPIRFSQICVRWRRQDIIDYLEQFGKKRAAPHKRRTG